MLKKFPLAGFNVDKQPLAQGVQEEAPEPEPTTAEGNKSLGENNIKKGQVHNAITRYKKAARMENSAENRTDLGDAYAFAELPLNAVKQYKRALKLNPQHPEPHFSLGEVYTRYGKWGAAVIEFSRAVELAPENPFYRHKLAQAYVKAERAGEGVEHLERAVELAPRDAFYRFELSDMYALLGRDDDALREMERATRVCPEDDYYVSRLGMLCVRTGDLQRAAKVYREAIRLNPDKTACYILLGDVYRMLGFETRAEHQYDRAEEIDDYEADFVVRARRFIQGGRW